MRAFHPLTHTPNYVLFRLLSAQCGMCTCFTNQDTCGVLLSSLSAFKSFIRPKHHHSARTEAQTFAGPVLTQDSAPCCMAMSLPQPSERNRPPNYKTCSRPCSIHLRAALVAAVLEFQWRRPAGLPTRQRHLPWHQSSMHQHHLSDSDSEIL